MVRSDWRYGFTQLPTYILYSKSYIENRKQKQKQQSR